MAATAENCTFVQMFGSFSRRNTSKGSKKVERDVIACLSV